MTTWSLRTAVPVVATTIFFFLSTMAIPAATAIVEHTFVVSQMNMMHLCKETLVTVVNGQLPGPTIEVTEGDSVAIHVVNKSPYNISIHWHGVKQRLNCWADGVPLVTQCPILPKQNFTYRFNVVGQEGTLWWHAHVPCLRATLHGAIVIRPRLGASSYPFPKPDSEVPVIIGDWWEMDLEEVDRKMKDNFFDYFPSASTINGKLGDLFNCSGVAEEGYVLDVEPGKTYLLRIINAALFSEYFLKIAGHRFTVVASDANYVSPYTTDIIVIAPGETVDALVVADAPPGKYYMVALPNQAPLPDTQTPEPATRGMVQYNNNNNRGAGNGATALRSRNHIEGGGGGDPSPTGDVPVAPVMPDQHDVVLSFYFHSNLTSLRHPRHPTPPVPIRVDEHLFITLGLGSVCRRGQYCNRTKENEAVLVATMNNVSFQLPTTPLLESHYYHIGVQDALLELPGKPPRAFDFTDQSLIPIGTKEKLLEPTSRATMVRWFRYGSVVEMVFQGTAILQGDSNPMHLHGHDMFVLAQGLGNFNAAKDMSRYNLVNPPLKNTVVVPNLGWVAIRFVANNPGVWFMHCHYEFHLSMGMAAVFVVEDGPTMETSLPPPPLDFPSCSHDNNLAPDEFYLQTPEIKVSRIDGV
ncbi:Laccase-15 [Dichanthelium oligosanthes]|uniref:Laccase n=1 Tax=Dichanthelium oligosanthes TaxID=888268 RepID=A0A1E5V8S3_9POAL|nr:Laccase-15 [Dichanthelium oligosanthes]